MFALHKRELPQVEKHILDMLGPRELVLAKQVCKDWAMVVRRYLGHMDATRTSDLMEMAFFEPVPIYAIVNLSQTVRDLTINKNKAVYVLGNDNIIKLDTLNFTMNKTMVLEKSEDPKEDPAYYRNTPPTRQGGWWYHLNLYCSNDGCKFLVDGFYKFHILEYKKSKSSEVLKFVAKTPLTYPICMQRNAHVVDTKIVSKTSRDPNLRQFLKEKLGALYIIELANNVYLVSAENPRNKEETLVGMVCEKNNCVTLKLIAQIGMRYAKLRVIGTRVFCYENGIYLTPAEPSHYVIVFDVWNPMSVKSNVGPVTIEQTNIRNEKTVTPLESEEEGGALWNLFL